MQNEPVLEISNRGNKRWRLNGELHREDGPAIEWADGEKEWYLNGKLHRTDGPAVEWEDGEKFWYSNNKLHRTDGPAVEYVNGRKEWWLHDREYNFEEWLELTPLSNKEKIKLRFKYAK